MTFDAEHPDRPQCPPGNQEGVVGVLREGQVRATFFLQGRWVTAYPDTARKIVDDGHLVGNHSDYHARMTLLSNDGLRDDVLGAEEKIRQIARADPRPWFRCPFGDGHDDPRVGAALAAAGYREIGWDVDGQDWENDQTAEGVERAIVERTLERGDGAVVLLHTWPAPTLRALPAILARLREAGASFVAVDQIVGATHAG